MQIIFLGILLQNRYVASPAKNLVKKLANCLQKNAKKSNTIQQVPFS